MSLTLKSVQKLAVLVPGRNVLDVTKHNFIRYRLVTEDEIGVHYYYDVTSKEFHDSGIPLHFVEEGIVPLIYDDTLSRYITEIEKENRNLVLQSSDEAGVSIFEVLTRTKDIPGEIFVFYTSDRFEEATVVLDTMNWKRGKWFTRSLDYGVMVKINTPYHVENLLSVLDSAGLTKQVAEVEHAVNWGKVWVYLTLPAGLLNTLIDKRGFDLCLNEKGVRVNATQLDDHLTVQFTFSAPDFNYEANEYPLEGKTPAEEVFMQDIVNCFHWYYDDDIFSLRYPQDLK